MVVEILTDHFQIKVLSGCRLNRKYFLNNFLRLKWLIKYFLSSNWSKNEMYSSVYEKNKQRSSQSLKIFFCKFYNGKVFRYKSWFHFPYFKGKQGKQKSACIFKFTSVFWKIVFLNLFKKHIRIFSFLMSWRVIAVQIFFLLFLNSKKVGKMRNYDL